MRSIRARIKVLSAEAIAQSRLPESYPFLPGIIESLMQMDENLIAGELFGVDFPGASVG
jgi:hypothetical protein